MGNAKLILGDCIEKMKELEANSIDAIITDPPYGLEFMGKEWDGFGDNENFQRWCKLWATEALRILKPGGFMFAMGGTRTHHRLTCGIEDAGFMIRDELCWVYMQGFPKAQDLGMLIEKKLGGEGKVVGKRIVGAAMSGNPSSEDLGTGGTCFGSGTNEVLDKQPTLPLAKEWQGWKTPALKPAFEPIVVAQKPCDGSITENVMKNGVGGYNIDECRIPYENGIPESGWSKTGADGSKGYLGEDTFKIRAMGAEEIMERVAGGRYPSNLLMQEECFGKLSKYFLIPKASRGEKEENLDDFEEKQATALNFNKESSFENRRSNNVKSTNSHPTVKPIALMQHLIKLTTKPGYTVCDPFLGSGTTAVAALNLNRNVVGIELNEEYMKIAKARIAEEVKQTRLV